MTNLSIFFIDLLLDSEQPSNSDQQVRLYKEKSSLGIFLDINVHVLISKAAELRNNSSPSKIISLSPSVLKNVTYVRSSIVTYYAATYMWYLVINFYGP